MKSRGEKKKIFIGSERQKQNKSAKGFIRAEMN
jgi:hypothetical protein